MAQYIVDIQDESVEEFFEAFCFMHGFTPDSSLTPEQQIDAKRQFTRARVLNFMQNTLLEYRFMKAQEQLRADIAAEIEGVIT